MPDTVPHLMLGGLSVVSASLWTAAGLTFMRDFRDANGRRPFISMTLSVSVIMTVMAFAFLVTWFTDPPRGAQWIVSISTRLGNLTVCYFVWQLHDRIVSYVKH